MFGFGFLSLGAVLLCLGSASALTPEEESSLKEALHPFVLECADEYGIPEEKFEEAKAKGSADDIDPCFISCFLKKAEFFDGDGKLDVEKTNAFVKAHLTSEHVIKFFEAVGGECAKVNDEEVTDGDKGCDRAKLLFDCIQELKSKIGD
uniref:Odorant binding protein 5 n=2 Tax=Mythimna separata TaxID=271217 RepID=A0A1V1WC53_MYTSE